MAIMGTRVGVTGVMVDGVIMGIGVQATVVMVDGVIMGIGARATVVTVDGVIMGIGVRVTGGMGSITDNTFFGQLHYNNGATVPFSALND
jgi:hypothetical protein